MPPKVDLVVVFRSSSGKIEPKPLARQNAKQASEQYSRLLQALQRGGLQAVGKRGERDGQRARVRDEHARLGRGQLVLELLGGVCGVGAAGG